MNKAQITKRYAKLMNDVETKDYYKVDLTNRVNCYVCDHCGHVTKTKDIAAGVTPMFHKCEACGKTARSSFYKDLRPLNPPTEEWYRPDLKEVLKMQNDALIEHVLSGGLCTRKVINR